MGLTPFMQAITTRIMQASSGIIGAAMVSFRISSCLVVETIGRLNFYRSWIFMRAIEMVRQGNILSICGRLHHQLPVHLLRQHGRILRLEQAVGQGTMWIHPQPSAGQRSLRVEEAAKPSFSAKLWWRGQLLWDSDWDILIRFRCHSLSEWELGAQ